MKRWILMLLCSALLLGNAAAAETLPFETQPPQVGETVGQWLDGAVSSVQNWAQESGELEVHGQAVRTVVADTVTITMSATVESKDEKQAQEKTNQIINDVIAGLRALGITDDQIVTSGYNITRKTSKVSFATVTGYVCRISLRVTLQDFDLINQALDVAVEKGANEVGRIAFSYSDEGAVYRQALADATEAAMAKAEILARTSGVQIHSLLELREGTRGSAIVNSYAPMEGGSGISSDTGTQIMADEIAVSANVTLVYRVK